MTIELGVALVCAAFLIAIIVIVALVAIRARRGHDDGNALPKGYDPRLPNHFAYDSLGDPDRCTEAHNHPPRARRFGRRGR